jgi:hypothetical protein
VSEAFLSKPIWQGIWLTRFGGLQMKVTRELVKIHEDGSQSELNPSGLDLAVVCTKPLFFREMPS